MSGERRRNQMQRMADEAVGKATRKHCWESAWAVSGAVIALASAYVTFYPRPVLVASETRDPTRLFHLIVTLSNNNLVPLEDVKVSFFAENLVTTQEVQMNGVTTGQFGWTTPRLSADDRFDIDLSKSIVVDPKHVSQADIRVRVSYQPWFIPWTRLKEFPFHAQKQTDGTLRLMAVPAG